MDLFTEFKKTKNIPSYNATKKVDEVFFVLNFDNNGAYIETQDNKGNIIQTNFLQYSGIIRSILKSVQLIQEKSDFAINWENPENKVYLHEHAYLIPQLLNCGSFINNNKELITLQEGISQIVININPEDGKNDFLNAAPVLLIEEETITFFHFINENHAYLLDNHTVIETAPVGNFFNSIELFEASFPADDLQKYLSLLFSYLDHPRLHYADYKVQHNEEKVTAVPTLIFEKVDADNSLYMRISETLPNASLDFLDDYEIYRFAQINEMEKVIHIKTIEHAALPQHINQLEKLLKKHVPRKGKKAVAEFMQDNGLFILPEEIASAFIYKELPHLLGEYIIAGTEKLKQYKINTAPPKLNLKLNHGIDFLEGDANLQFGEDKISLFDAISQYQKNKYIVLSNGSHAFVNDSYMQKLQRIFKKKDKKVKLSFFDLPLAEDLIDEKAANQQFSLSREIFQGFNKLAEEKTIFPKVNASLRPYQQQGYKWLKYLYDKQLGGCLADDMGLGKTLQTLTLLTEVYKKETKPSLVVMPKSLLFNWENEVKKFAPGLSFYTYYAGDRIWEEAMKANLIFTTYAMVRNDIEEFKKKEFCYVILDESQNIKNTQAQVSKAVKMLQCDHRLALSGTPVENNLGELYSLFSFLNAAMFGSSDQFNKNYLTPVQKNNNKEATHDLRRKIYPFILRRLKKDVLRDLPDKIEQTLYLEMTPQQARYYEQRRIFYKEAIAQQVAQKGVQQAQFFIFQALNELRQIACIPEALTEGRIASPKVELLIEQLSDALANGHKVLVFANYLNAIELIGEQLNEQGIDYVSMTGSTRDRKKLVDRFQTDPECKVFLMTLKTGGLGLNLTAADTIFIFDPWWNKAAENQAIDRAHRIGQDKKVLCYKLITQSTIEEKILQLQQAKSELFNNIISSDSASLKSFSEEDVQYILGE